MPYALTAPIVEDHAALLNFEQVARTLGGGAAGQVLAADGNGNAAWSSAFPTSVGSRTLFVPSVVSGLTWPGGANNTSCAYSHEQPTPVNALYLVTYIDSASNTQAWPIVRSPSVGGCTILVTDPFGNPPVGTAFALYVLAVLEY